jgi:hypothetical protein
MSGSTTRPETLAAIEDVEFLLSVGEHPENIIRRLGKKPAALVIMLRRHRPDLLPPIQAEANRNKRKTR